MKLTKLFLAIVLSTAITSTASAIGDIKGEYAPNVYTGSPNTIGDIKGEYRPNTYKSWSAIGDIKGEFQPYNGYSNEPEYWFDFLDGLFGY